jgi:DNA-binding YbaB/EbfC family protein
MKGLGDMGQLLRQAKQLQAQFQAKQAEIQALRVSASSGGGMVTATVSGQGDLIDVAVEREVVDPEDVEMLTDLLLAAVQQAQADARAKAEEILGPMTQGMGIPGL